MSTQAAIVKSGRRILLIEDNVDFLAPLVAWTIRDGRSAVPTRSRDDALNKLLFESFPYILMDYQMPGMPAEEFVNLVRKLYPRTIIILTTGGSDAYELASSLGVSYVLQKPFSEDDFKSLLRRIAAVHGVPAV